MEIKDIKQKRTILDGKISELIRDFEIETETDVNRVSLTHVSSLTGETKTVGASIEISI